MTQQEKALVSEARGYLARAAELLMAGDPPTPSQIDNAVADLQAGDAKLQQACPSCDPTDPPS